VNLEARCLVVGLDFSETGSRALEQALALAKGTPGADLHIVHVATLPIAPIGAEFGWEAPGASLASVSDRLRGQVELQFQSAGGDASFGSVTLHVKIGQPAEGIARLAAEVDADMIVIGTHGRRGLRRLVLGSVAEATVRLAGCPVLVVRPKDHVREGEPATGWVLGTPVVGRS
jgi:nucleotide-binding universal stress UspA family protein